MDAERAKDIVLNKMLAKDAFSKWLGIEVTSIGQGQCTLQMVVSDQMTNGFGIAHGGIAYSLADSALAFAANSHGQQAVSIETQISHLRKVSIGDTLVATAIEINRNRSLGVYEVSIHNQDNKPIAHFKGTVYLTGNDWD